LPECFALVAEAIDRRLGVWRLLDDESLAAAVPAQAVPAQASPAVAEAIASVAAQRRYRQPGDILLSGEFYAEARRRDSGDCLKFQPTAEQFAAAIHLMRGCAVQMDAGEGKTVAIAPEEVGGAHSAAAWTGQRA